MSKIVSKNINKSTATEGFEKSNGEKYSRFSIKRTVRLIESLEQPS